MKVKTCSSLAIAGVLSGREVKIIRNSYNFERELNRRLSICPKSFE